MLLEDKILRMIELKEQGIDDKNIAELMSIGENTINNYYNSTREVLSKYAYLGKDIEKIASEIGFSFIGTQFAINHYGINLVRKSDITKPRTYKPKKERMQHIKTLRGQGKSLEEISQETGLSKVAVQNYAYSLGISLANKNKPKEQRIQEIKTLREQGKTLEEMTRETGLTKETIQNYVRSSGISLAEKTAEYKSKEQRIQEIKTLREQGKTLEEMTRETGLTKETIQNYVRSSGISLYKSRQEKIAEIANLIPQVNYIEEITEITKLTLSSIIHYREDLKKLGLKLPEFRGYFIKPQRKSKKLRDKLIRRGLTLRQIAKKEKTSHQAIKQYIDLTGQYKQWRESREHYENKTRYKLRIQELENIVNLCFIAARKNASETELWAFDKTQEYFFKHHFSNYNFNNLLEMLKTYKTAQNNGEKLSLGELGEDKGIENFE